jgi:hypothetical protein
VAKWLTRWSAKPVFAGSIPARCSSALLERYITEQMPGSVSFGNLPKTYTDLNRSMSDYSMAVSAMDQLIDETSSSIERRNTTCSMASLFMPTVLIPAVICA